MKEIFMLRARWRELETGLRTRLNRHEGGKPPDTAKPCPDGPPRQFPTLPIVTDRYPVAVTISLSMIAALGYNVPGRSPKDLA